MDVKLLLNWLTGNVPSKKNQWLCQNRDIFQARLDHLQKILLKNGVTEVESYLVIATLGEIGNNCFDHNLGQWKTAFGCWLQYEVTNHLLVVFIADQGQGVLNSLKRADPTLSSDQDALETAFSKRISGRHPEKRGNGLKFVRNVINHNPNKKLICISGSGKIELGSFDFIDKVYKKLKTNSISGTLTFLGWNFKNEN